MTPQPRVVVRAGAFGDPQRRSHAVKRLDRAMGHRGFVQGRVDLLRRPAGEGAAGRGLAEAASFEDVDRETGNPGPRAARRTLVRHVDPDLGEAPRLVERHLPAPGVGGVIDLQDDVREVAAVHVDLRLQFPRARRAEIDDLVRLQQRLCPVAAAEPHQVGGPEGLDRRSSRSGDQPGQARQPLRGLLVIRAGRLADDHRRGRLRLPVLQAALVVLDLLAGDVDSLAAGAVRSVERRRQGVAAPATRLRDCGVCGLCHEAGPLGLSGGRVLSGWPGLGR